MRLKLGVINVLNVLPVYYSIISNQIKVPAEIVTGRVTELNQKLEEGIIDISVISSYEYARHSNLYYVLPHLSVGADGPVHSIYLFLDKPLSELEGAQIRLTPYSLTSVHLIQYLLKDYSIRYVHHSDSPADGELLIADDAIKRFYRNDYRYCYDLSELWKKLTGLPFVFALWCIRKDAFEKNPLAAHKVQSVLIDSKRNAECHWEQMAKEYFKGVFPDQASCLKYLKNIHYHLNPSFQDGYMLFQKKMVEIGKLKNISPLEMLPEV